MINSPLIISFRVASYCTHELISSNVDSESVHTKVAEMAKSLLPATAPDSAEKASIGGLIRMGDASFLLHIREQYHQELVASFLFAAVSDELIRREKKAVPNGAKPVSVTLFDDYNASDTAMQVIQRLASLRDHAIRGLALLSLAFGLVGPYHADDLKLSELRNQLSEK